MTIQYKLITLAFTGPKGGTGKTTLTALFTEYLLYQKKRVNLIDSDPSQLLGTWIGNCQEEGRSVNSSYPVDYRLLDAAGVSGGELTSADYLIVPFIPHYADLQVLINWFNQLSPNLQKRVYFLPNRYQKTKEQKQGLQELEKIVQFPAQILPSLSNRPALFAPLLGGSAKNFFTISQGKTYLSFFHALFKQLRLSRPKTTAALNYA